MGALRILHCAALAAVMTLLGGGPASAATRSTQLGIQVTLTDTCVVTATPLVFPTYIPGGGPLQGTSTISVRCTNGDLFAVGLGTGATAGASYAQRLLANGTSTLQYNLYTTAARTAVWGDGSGTTAIVSGRAGGLATPVLLTVYGALPDSAANRGAGSGNYSDTVLVVLSY